MSLGTFISKRRKQKMMTQEMLAERIHVSKSAIAKWETDGGIPDRDNLKNLADVLNVTVDDLHRIIRSENMRQEESTNKSLYLQTDLRNDVLRDDSDKSLVADIVAVFEEHGYKVIRPQKHPAEAADLSSSSV